MNSLTVSLQPNRWICYVSILTATFLLSHCGQEPTHFSERHQVAKINMTVDSGPTSNDASSADATAVASAKLPEAIDVASAFDSLDGEPLPINLQTNAVGKDDANVGTSSDTEPLGNATATTQAGSEPLGPLTTEQPSAQELAACARLQGVAVGTIMIVGNQPDVKITQNAVAAIKLAGNKPHLELSLVGPESARIGGLCLFLAGNQAEAQVTLGVEAGRIIYIGRGNLSHSDISLTRALDFLAVDLAGNQASLHVSGSGSHPCPAARLSGNGSHFECE